MNLINPLQLSGTLGPDPNGPRAELGKQDFLHLLVTQLRNQDPLNVQQDKDFIAQLAQFSNLEQSTNLNDTFGNLFEFQQLTQSSALIGKNVEARLTGTGLQGDFVQDVQGQVKEARMIEGKVKLVVGEDNALIDVEDILKVK